MPEKIKHDSHVSHLFQPGTENSASCGVRATPDSRPCGFARHMHPDLTAILRSMNTLELEEVLLEASGMQATVTFEETAQDRRPLAEDFLTLNLRQSSRIPRPVRDEDYCSCGDLFCDHPPKADPNALVTSVPDPSWLRDAAMNHAVALLAAGGHVGSVVDLAREINAFLSGDEPSQPVATDSTTAEIEDGFGGCWSTCGPGCDLQVVRPGKVQCNHTSSACPDAPAPEPSDRAGLSEDVIESIAEAIYDGGDEAEWMTTDDGTANSAAWEYARRAGRVVADRFAVAEQERDEARRGEVRAAVAWDREVAWKAEAEQEAATLRAKVAAVAALHRSDGSGGMGPFCVECARVDAHPDQRWPCATIAALGDSAQVVQRIKDEATEAAAALVDAEVESEVERLTTAECPDPWKEPMLGNWLGGMRTAAKVIRGERARSQNPSRLTHN